MSNFEVKVTLRYVIWLVLGICRVPYRWLKQSSGLVPYPWDTLEVQYCPLKSLSELCSPRTFSSNWLFDQYSPLDWESSVPVISADQQSSGTVQACWLNNFQLDWDSVPLDCLSHQYSILISKELKKDNLISWDSPFKGGRGEGVLTLLTIHNKTL